MSDQLNMAHQVTVHWMPELTPTLESRTVALEIYHRQCTEDDVPPLLFTHASLGVWGFIGPSAALLFRIPAPV